MTRRRLVLLTAPVVKGHDRRARDVTSRLTPLGRTRRGLFRETTPARRVV
jgi:hypothetical protein